MLYAAALHRNQLYSSQELAPGKQKDWAYVDGRIGYGTLELTSRGGVELKDLQQRLFEVSIQPLRRRITGETFLCTTS